MEQTVPSSSNNRVLEKVVDLTSCNFTKEQEDHLCLTISRFAQVVSAEVVDGMLHVTVNMGRLRGNDLMNATTILQQNILATAQYHWEHYNSTPSAVGKQLAFQTK